MHSRALRTASTLCVLTVTAGYLHCKSNTSCRGGLLAFRSVPGKGEQTTMNAGFMDMFKGGVGSGSMSKGSWSPEEFQKMVKAIETAGSASVDVIPGWDELERLLREQEDPSERTAYDVMLSGLWSKCS